MNKPTFRYLVRVYSTRGIFERPTTAKSADQAINFVRHNLRNEGVFVKYEDCVARRVA